MKKTANSPYLNNMLNVSSVFIDHLVVFVKRSADHIRRIYRPIRGKKTKFKNIYAHNISSLIVEGLWTICFHFYYFL